jgi:hypothetical protein
MTTYQEILLWTALPNGIDSSGHLKVSVFLSPQLGANPNPVPPAFTALNNFPDWINWPNTVKNGAFSFSVIMKQGLNTFVSAATNATPAPPTDPTVAWPLIFKPTTTEVTTFTFTDYLADMEIASYSSKTILDFVSGLYGIMGDLYPQFPPLISASRQTDYNSLDGGSDTNASALVVDLEQLGAIDNPPLINSAARPHVLPVTTVQGFQDLRTFHKPPTRTLLAPMVAPTLDFHAALTGLNHYPLLLRMFNLVFDLTIPVPATLATGQLTVQVVPRFIPAVGATPNNVSLLTQTTFATGTTFQPSANPGTTDYANRMLDLSDTSRFSVSGIDTDLAGERLINAGSQLIKVQNTQALRRQQRYGNRPEGVAAVTLPALKQIGPQVFWDGYAAAGASGFSGLLGDQSSLNAVLQAHITGGGPLPLLYARNVTRGHRLDVFTASEGSPTWRSLHGRHGQYIFGPNSGGAVTVSDLFDEGMIIPSASQKTSADGTRFPILNVHESIFRWEGWGLSAQRPGSQADLEISQMVANPKNNAPLPTGVLDQPQMSAYFTPPKPADSNVGGLDFLFPKLRFGSQYQFRARGVDLAGNSLPISSTDATTATGLFTHYRYEPVRPPTFAGAAPFQRGEGTYVMVLLDDQVATPTPDERWIFPPRAGELMVEQHGMLDGFVLGSPNDPTKGPAGDVNTYKLLAFLDGLNLSTMPDVAYDPTMPSSTKVLFDTDLNKDVPYFNFTPWTPWTPDPMSDGLAFLGLPGTLAPTVQPWFGTWPVANPVLLKLSTGVSPTTSVTAPTNSTPGEIDVTIPPGFTHIVRVSSSLANPGSPQQPGIMQMGQYQWFSPSDPAAFLDLSLKGQNWLLSPFQVVRMIHAVRTPLVAPAFQAPLSSRSTPGVTTVDINDPKFLVDAKSTSQIDVEATWTDIYDNPADPASDPSAPASAAPTKISHVTTTAPAFKLTVPDPAPVGPYSVPMTIVEPPQAFALAGNDNADTHAESATHHIGDTKHHLVRYQATGTSRFADMFTNSKTVMVTPGTPYTVTDAAHGLNPAATTVTYLGAELTQGASGFTVNAATGQITVSTSVAPVSPPIQVTIEYQPSVIKTGPMTPVHVLSSAPPKAPVISQMLPSWQNMGPAGTLGGGGIGFERVGGFIRVYLERPWYTSGDNELLGVVTTVTQENNAYSSTFPTKAQQKFVTMMGLDPINYVGASNTPWPIVPTRFEHLANVPVVPYRKPHSHPPRVNLLEDESSEYFVWPYDVNYDPVTQRWYADIAPRPGITQTGTYPPPPYFIRLALCRFQPYSMETFGSSQIGPCEVSPVVQATFAQPVPDRVVTVLANTADSTHTSVLVTVTGPGYQGWRPPVKEGFQLLDQYDADNLYAPSNPSIYGSSISITQGKQHTSTMVVEVQVQNPALNSLGLKGELAWASVAKDTVKLTPTFSGQTQVTWGSIPGHHNYGTVHLPYATTSSTKMRLRISELDYYTGTTLPSTIDTSLRRPFVTHIPIN